MATHTGHRYILLYLFFFSRKCSSSVLYCFWSTTTRIFIIDVSIHPSVCSNPLWRCCLVCESNLEHCLESLLRSALTLLHVGICLFFYASSQNLIIQLGQASCMLLQQPSCAWNLSGHPPQITIYAKILATLLIAS